LTRDVVKLMVRVVRGIREYTRVVQHLTCGRSERCEVIKQRAPEGNMGFGRQLMEAILDL